MDHVENRVIRSNGKSKDMNHLLRPTKKDLKNITISIASNMIKVEIKSLQIKIIIIIINNE